MPMIPCDPSCCNVTSLLCDPATGGRVYVVINLNENTTSYINENATPWTGDPATLVDCHPDIVVTSDGTTTGVSQSGEFMSIIDITLLGNSPGNLLAIDSNGGLFVDCAALAACVPTITTDGDSTGVTTSGGVTDIVVTSGDADNDLTIGTDGGTYFNLCDALSMLAVTNDVPNDGVTGEMVVGIDENGDCVLFDPPEGCCVVSTTMCDPATGEAIIVAIDLSAGTSTYWMDNGSAWTGDANTLVDCSSYVDCSGAAVAPGSAILTVSDVTNGGYGLYMPFVPDPADPTGCSPAPRTSCLDVPAFTVNYSNIEYTSAGGSSNWIPQHEEEVFISNPTTANNFNPPNFTIPAGSAPGIYTVPGSEFCHRIENTQPCRKITCLTFQGYGYWQANVLSSDWFVQQYGTLTNNVNGTLFPTSNCDETWTQIRNRTPQIYVFNMGYCYSRTTLDPGEYMEQCGGLEIRVLASGSTDLTFSYGTVGGNGFCFVH